MRLRAGLPLRLWVSLSTRRSGRYRLAATSVLLLALASVMGEADCDRALADGTFPLRRFRLVSVGRAEDTEGVSLEYERVTAEP